MEYLNLAVMLTQNDVTVKNAKEIFLEAKDAPAKYWGCKSEGIEENKLYELFNCMKKANKETILETLKMDEKSCLNTARMAAKCGATYLLGAVYYDSVKKICDDAGVKYAPFAGLDIVDTRLRGTVEEIVNKVKDVEAEGVCGISLSGFRYVSGDPVELIRAVGGALEKPLILAGGVNSYERLDILKSVPNLFIYTIGGAFFEKRFGETFSEQIQVVQDYMGKTVTAN